MTSWDADPAHHDDETGLVERAVSGDRAAFEQLYRRHRDRVYGLAWRIAGGDAALAEDPLDQEAGQKHVVAAGLTPRAGTQQVDPLRAD